MNQLAAALRENLALGKGDACRLLHGRGHTYPGWEQVAVDYFPPLLLVTLFEPLPKDNFDQLVAVLQTLAGEAGVDCIAVQSRFNTDLSFQVISGQLPRKPFAEEAGLRFGLQLGKSQNIGFFLDMAAARRWLAAEASGKRVLNLFAYSCAFSVVARAAGASSVVNLDMSSAALRLGQQNHQRNGINSGVSYLSHNLFRSWGRLRRAGPFDLIIVDPPSRQPGSFVAGKDYQRVLAKLPSLCAGGAQLLMCLNSPHMEGNFLLDLARQYAPQLQFQRRLPNPPQFVDEHSERSLKVLLFSYCESK